MYHLRWTKLVSRALLDRCARADQSLRDAILDAMGEIESTLRIEPEFVGESRDAGKRFVIVKPLSITYRIDHRNRLVYIIGARVHRVKD
jgi:hypothetical protein